MTPLDELKIKLAELNECLEGRLPNRASVLEKIWTSLRAQPENVTLMSEEDVGLIVKGLMHQTQVQIAKPAVKKSSKSVQANFNLL